MIAMLVPRWGFAQTIVVNGTGTNQYVPMYNWYNDYGFRSEYVIPASYFSSAGIPSGASLNSITLYRSATGTWTAKDLTIILTNTSTTYYSSTSFLGLSGTTVYTNSSYSGGTNSSYTFTFSSPFTYTGGSLVVHISSANGGTATSSSSGSTWLGISSTTNYQGCYAYGSNSASATTGTRVYFLPKTAFTYTTPPSNSTCATATILSCGSTLNGTTVGTSGTTHGISGASISNYGVWYTFTGDGGETTVSSSTGGEFDHGMAIARGSCNNLTLLDVVDGQYASGTESYNFTTVSGETYYIYVAHYDSNSSTTGTFTISRTCSYTVSYNANGGTGTMTDPNSPYISGSTVTVLANTFTAPSGMTFNGWNTAANGSGTSYSPGATFTITANTTLYAQWTSSVCTPTWSYSNTAYYISNFTAKVSGESSAQINNTTSGTSCSTSDYYNSFSISAAAGSTILYNTTASANSTWRYGFWVDWNQDGSFDDTGNERIYNSNSYINLEEKDFTIPANTPIGEYRMRVMIDYYGSGYYLAPCGSNSYGEAEDYKLIVTAPLVTHTITANIWPSAGGTVSGNTTVTHGGSTSLTATANSGYQFVNWTDSDGDVVSSSATLSLTNVTSDATYQANFTSTSATSLLWTENFESYSNVTSSAWGYLNGEWATPLRDNKAPCVTYYSAAATSGYRSLELRADNSTNMVVLPQFNQALNTLLISFQIGRGDSSSGYTVELGYVTNPSDASTFTALTTVPIPSSAVGSHTQFSYNLATNNNTPSNTNYRLAIRYTMTGSDSWYLDDFSVSVPTYTVTTTVSPSGAGSVSGLASGGTYTNGSTCSLTATPTANSGYTFTNWTENNTEVSSNATYSFTVTDSHNLTANFTLASYSITVTANPTAGGTVTGGGTYSHGASVTLSATANTGYNFVNWTENGNVVSTSASYTFTATAAGDYVANFEERCPSPTDLVASANNNSITVTWNGGSASSWQVYVSSSNSAPSASDSGTPVSTNSYTEGSLSVGQTRYFWVRTDCGSNEYSAWVGPVDATTACTAPTNLVAYPSSTGAVLTWDGGEGEEYTVQYSQVTLGSATTVTEGFEHSGSMPDGWIKLDLGDGNNTSELGVYNGSGVTHDGSYCFRFSSFLGSSSGSFDQYLISPELNNITALSFYYRSSSTSTSGETFRVGYSTTTNDVSAFTWVSNGTTSLTSYSQFTASNIPANAKYFAINYTAVYQYRLYIDDISYTYRPSVPGSWNSVSGTHSSPYNLTGLTTGNTYYARVTDQCGNESNVVSFTPACSAPVNVAADPSNRSAEITWLGGESSYDVRYKKGFSYDFESAEPWTYTDFSPCTTYDGDGGSTYGFQSYTFPNQNYVGACIAFQNGINNNMASHGGNAFGVMFNTDGPTNDWFILPEITIQDGDYFSLWIREITDQYGDETINVGICGSTDGTFSAYLAQNLAISSTDYEKLSYDLSSYAGQTIRLAINCASNDIFGVMIDDIFVGNPNDSWTTVNNVTSPDTITGLTANTNYVVQVQSTSCGDWVGTNFTTLNEFNVTANVNPANLGTVTGTGTYAEGSNVTLTATPATGYAFQNWTIGGSEVGTDPSYTITNLQADVTVQANFLLVGYTITAVADPAGGGTFAFTGEDVISSTATTAQVSPDGNVTVTATATAGYTFMNWVEGGSVVSTTNAYALTDVNASHDLTAHFVDMTASNTWPAAVTTLAAATPGYSVDGSTITISNANGLAWLISTVNGLNSQSGNDITSSTVINLTADVDMSAHIWVPIGTTEHPFVGTFNGNGHTISGVTRALEFPNQGVFGYVSGGTIHDVVVNTNITGDCNYMGSVAGTLASGTVYNTGSTGTVTANANTIAVGGTVGYNGGLVHSSFATGIFTGLAGDYVGGLVGENAPAGCLYNSYSNATLTGGNRGGLVGYNKGTAANCYNVNNSATYAYANINAGTMEYVYSDNTNNSYYNTIQGSPTLQYHGSSFSAVQSDIKHLDYMYRDNAITLAGGQTSSYVPSSVSYDNNHTVKWNGLVSALNQWVEANKTSGVAIGTLSSWYRPLTTAINGDLPVLGFGGETTLGAANGSPKTLKYGTMDDLLTTYSGSTASIFHYGKATGVTHVPTANVNVFINEDAVLLQATSPNPGPFINTTVGVTFDNSDHGTHAYDYWGNKLNYDWHFMSTPLSDAKIGATYDDYEAHGFGSDIDIKTLVNSYFPNNLPMTLHDANWRWDFYTYYEPEYHWINMKRNKNNHYHVDGGWSISYTYNADDQAVGDAASLACVFTPGKGYMMAISKDVFMNSTGTLNRGNVPIRLTLKEPGDINYASGWNLVGNPYQAYLNINALNRNLYIYDADQGVYAPYAPAASGNPATPSQYIHPHQAFFVHAASDGEELIFTPSMASTETTPYSYYRDDRIDYPLVNLYAENNAGQRDLTVVEFHRPELGGARKLETMRNAPFTLAAHYAGISYGILFATDDIERIPVRFKTDENGWVTLTWSTHNGEFSKLLLIDNKLGVEHNMLADNSYTFEASPDDYSSRFYIVYDCSGMGVEENEDTGGASTGSATAGTFAYINNGNIVIDIGSDYGASIQVIDVLGRVLYSKTIAGTDGTCTVSTKGLAKGVYLIRLADGHNVKTQKLVVQ